MTPYSSDPDGWKSATGDHIYPRSFAGSNGDGIADMPGITGKLDCLADLRVGFIWLSPVFSSYKSDDGYDISDYQIIAPKYGSLAGMDRLIAEAKERGIGIVMDLVVNHSSDEHAWFRSALQGREAPYRDFYIWRDPVDGGPPNDQQSYFGGSAWEYDRASGQSRLHLFDMKQPGLNRQNPALCRAIYEMMICCPDRGIAGVSMDVFDLIGMDLDAQIFADAPDLHPFLREMHATTLKSRNVVTVGEAWSATPAGAHFYSGRDAGLLFMVFPFETVSQKWAPVVSKWTPKPFDLLALKRVFNRRRKASRNGGWNPLVWGRQDLPRAVFRYGYGSEAAGKMLSMVLRRTKGTPTLCQGEEIGMTDAAISQFRDVETLNFYATPKARTALNGPITLAPHDASASLG